MKFTNVKKWLSMLLVVCSMLSLAACGGNDSGAGEIAGRVLQLHRGVSFLGNVNRCGGKTVRRPRRTA